MKKTISILLFISSIFGYGQSKYTITQAEQSENPKVLANFIVNNPKHPKIFLLKQKLAYLMTKDTNLNNNASKPQPNNHIIPNTKRTDKSTDILNYLLNDTKNSSSSYVVVKNLSKCSITVHFSGQKNYQLEISPQSTERLLVEKGNYNISSKVCNAHYNRNKQIINDFEMSLNSHTISK